MTEIVDLDPILDRPLRGALKIGKAAGIIDDDNDESQLRASYYALETGLVDADKAPGGRGWVSTLRRILRQHASKTA